MKKRIVKILVSTCGVFLVGGVIAGIVGGVYSSHHQYVLNKVKVSQPEVHTTGLDHHLNNSTYKVSVTNSNPIKNSQPVDNSGKSVGSKPNIPNKPQVVVNPSLTWVNNQTQFLDLANLKKGMTLGIDPKNFGCDNPEVTYYVSSPLLDGSVITQTNNANGFNVNSNLNQLLSTDAYSFFSVVAKANVNGETIASSPLNVVVYNTANVPVNKNQTALYWITTDYQQTSQYCNAPVSFSLLTKYKLQPGEHFEIQRSVTEFWNQDGTYTSVVNLNSDSNTFDTSIMQGYQNLRLCVVNANNQVVAVSNTLSINGVQEYCLNINAVGVHNHLVQVGADGNAIIQVATNINGFSLTNKNIYYQNAETNNQWVCAATESPKSFEFSISNNEIDISNFYLNTSTNFKIVDPTTATSSSILTLSSFVWTGGCQANVYVNNNLLASNNAVCTVEKQNITVTVKPSKPNAEMFNINLYQEINGKWTSVDLKDNNYSFTPEQYGAYKFKVVTGWLNDSVTPGQTSYFTINVSENIVLVN